MTDIGGVGPPSAAPYAEEVTMVSWYPRAIEELSKIADTDAKAILFRIAQKRPKAIVDACAPALEKEPEWVNECRSLMRVERKIDAIKLWRHHAGIGLKEAKDAVEALVL